MRKKVACFLGVLFLVFLPQVLFPAGPVPAAESARTEFDYSKYLAPEAFRATEDSQGTLYIIDAGGTKALQALVIDDKRGLILSMAHGLSENDIIVNSEKTIYLLIYKETVFRAKVENYCRDRDLAIFKLETDGENCRLLKQVKFTKNFEPFTEHYAISRDFLIYADNGFSLFIIYPYRANLVDETTVFTPKTTTFLLLDKAVKPGFSGSGVFNNKGEVVGIFSATWWSHAVAISTETILNFIEEYNKN